VDDFRQVLKRRISSIMANWNKVLHHARDVQKTGPKKLEEGPPRIEVEPLHRQDTLVNGSGQNDIGSTLANFMYDSLFKNAPSALQRSIVVVPGTTRSRKAALPWVSSARRTMTSA